MKKITVFAPPSALFRPKMNKLQTFFKKTVDFFSNRVIIAITSEDLIFSAVGVDGVEGPPVPIPNTVVKLNSAEDTKRAASRKNRAMPTHKSNHPIGWLFFFSFIGFLFKQRLRNFRSRCFIIPSYYQYSYTLREPPRLRRRTPLLSAVFFCCGSRRR